MSRGKVSVIMPARVEPYITKTLNEVLNNASGDIEVILVLDGVIPDYKLPNDKRLRIYHNSRPYGLRPCLNAAIDVAKGKYILKVDAHCMIGEDWDTILKADCEDNWIVIPRRYWLDAPNWQIKVDQNNNIGYVDAMAYLYPFTRVYQPRLTARPWPAYADAHADEMITEDMSYQGSMWFMHRKHWHRIGGMNPEHGYGTFGEEPQEIGLKTQLGPWEGKIMRNKKTWYAHWSKPMIHWRTDPEVAGRVTDEEFHAANNWCFHYWWYNQWEERVHDFQWLIDKFWPLPRWPENWRWLVDQYNRYEMPKHRTVLAEPIDTAKEFQIWQ